jgi:hypothetical protein
VRVALCAGEGGCASQAESRHVSAVDLIATSRWGQKQNVLSADRFALATASHMLTSRNVLQQLALRGGDALIDFSARNYNKTFCI